MAAPSTSTQLSSIVVDWTAPWNGGSAITSYTVQFRESDGVTYTELKEVCDGTQTTVIQTRSCTISSEVFTSVPLSLEWGASIFAKVLATNSKGSSALSLPGNGGIIYRVPDAPVNLANVPSITTSTQIGLEWQDGPNDGGAPIEDYIIEYA